MMSNRRSYTIQPSDVGKYSVTAHGEVWHIGAAIGRIQGSDVGKRAYRDETGLVQVENEEQYRVRLQCCQYCDLPTRLSMRNRQIRDLRRSTRK